MQTQRILILGNGGREYSIGLCLSQDSRVEALYFAPGNGATLLLGKNITYNDNHDLVRICKELDIT
ncbi:MAG: phosphoribosylamine--glycine ligase, partial [Helicobacter sp.]|nr:phosphoribosylamine--glycine ligase [Helicobacter sp.]